MEVIPYLLPVWLTLDVSQFVSFNIDFKLDLFVLSVEKTDIRNHETPYHFTVTQVVMPDVIINHQIPPIQTPYDFVQPLSQNRFLLIDAISYFYDNDKFDLNGHIYDFDGNLTHQICLGDGIAHVQTTADDKIWTCYHDQGITGNHGWYSPLGSHGLNQWDIEGNILYQYQPKVGLDSIRDCYALCVTSKNET